MSEVKRIIAQKTLKKDRNAKIYQDYLKGIRQEVIAVKYNLSGTRIYYIVQQQKKLEEVKK